MPVTATRTTTLVFSGDVTGTETISAASNTSSAGMIEIRDLASGFNSITVPTGGATVPTAVTIIPPSGNATAITVKGVTGDTGLRVHNTDPFTISLHSSVTAVGLTAGGAIAGVRFHWS